MAIISLVACSFWTEARLGGGTHNHRVLAGKIPDILTEFKPVQPKPDPPGGFGSPSSSNSNTGRVTGTTPPPPPPAPASYSATSSVLPEQASVGSSEPADEETLEDNVHYASVEVPSEGDNNDEGGNNSNGDQGNNGGGGSKLDGSFYNGDYPDIAAAFTPINP